MTHANAPDLGRSATLLEPAELYPDGAGRPAFTLIDVRAPVEVARGALPGARALPLMTDDERHLVGLRYAEAGQEAAIALGHELVGPHLPERVAAWRAVCEAGPAAIACWRGGLRSELVVRFMERDVPRVKGGYRAVRRHLVGSLAPTVARKRCVVLTGLTGSGKTELLRRLGPRAGVLQVVDLEGAARHRGSAFGATAEPQPSQQTFENALAVELLLDPAGGLVVEDESRYVGRRTLPDPLLAAMRAAPLVVLEVPLAARAAHIFEEYVAALGRAVGVGAARDRLGADVMRIRKSLGGGRTDRVVRALDDAVRAGAWFELEAHAGWIAALLEAYYDRLYLKARRRHERPVAFAGDAGEVEQYLRGLRF